MNADPRLLKRTPRLWKVLDGALDMLPYEGMTEAELVQWMEFVEQALRRWYGLMPTNEPAADSERPTQ